MDSRDLGLLIIAVGALLLLAGVLVYSGALGWFGRLPGDLRFGRDSTRIFFPLGSMILLSVVLSLLLSFLRRFF